MEKWSDEEKQWLRNKYALYGAKTAARRFQRSIDSVYYQVKFLKIQKRKSLYEDIKKGVKLCPFCKTRKPLSEFYASKREKTGLDSYCKFCVKLSRYKTQLLEGVV